MYDILRMVKSQNTYREMVYVKQLRRIIQGIAAFVLCAALLCGTAFADVESNGGPFPDVPADADYAEAAAVLAELGIFKGDSAGNFNPDQTISRAEAAAVICRMLGVEDEAKQLTSTTFTDIPAGHWSVGYAAKAAELGIINGYGNGKFGPGDPVTFEQMVKMLVCAWGYGEKGQAQGGYPSGYLIVANELGITNGAGSSNSQGIPRSVVAQLTYNTLNTIRADFWLGE